MHGKHASTGQIRSTALISARQAYVQLLHQSQPMMALAMPCRIVAGAQGCLPARIVVR